MVQGGSVLNENASHALGAKILNMLIHPVFIGTATETFTPTQSGAIATIMYQLSRQAIAHGFQPSVIAKRAHKADPFEGVPYQLFDYPQVPEGGLLLKLRRAERKIRGWTHLCQGTWMARVAHLLAEPRYQGRPWIIYNGPELIVDLRRRYPDATIIGWFQNQLHAKPKARKQFAQACDQVWGVSDFTSDWIADYYGLDRDLVHTVYNAVDLDPFRPAQSPPSGPPVIQFVGRTGIEKAPDLLLKACLELSDRTTAFRVRIVGSNHWDRYTDDHYQKQLRQLVDRLTKRGVQVEQTGHVGRQALPALMASAHIHVTPSRWDEPFGLTTLEGMACGLATLAGNHGGSPEVLGEAGVLFERDDPIDLANKLEPLVTDSSRRLAVGQACRQRALGFTWQATWERLTTLLCDSEKRQAEQRLSI